MQMETIMKGEMCTLLDIDLQEVLIVSIVTIRGNFIKLQVSLFSLLSMFLVYIRRTCSERYSGRFNT